MKSNILKRLLLVFFLFVSLGIDAQEFEINGVWYGIYSNGEEVAILGYTEDVPRDLVIPEKISYQNKDYIVRSIGDFAFEDCTRLNSIVIPNSVNDMGGYVFEKCVNLTSVVLSNSLERIPMYTFAFTNLKSIVIPNSVTTIDDYAFLGCTSLTSIRIPESVTSIGEEGRRWNPFIGCSGLESIIVESGNPVFDSRDNCNAIIDTKDKILITGCKNTVIPSDVTFIGQDAFRGCSSLTTIDLPKDIISIGAYAFYGCTGLTSIKVESENPVYDSRNNCNAIIRTDTNTLFIGCPNTVIPNSVTALGAAFACYIDIESFNIPNGVLSINGTFVWCESLKSVVLPNSIEDLGYDSFNGCKSLEHVYCYAENVPIATRQGAGGGYDTFANSNIAEATLHVPASSIEAYRNDYSWQNFKSIVALTDSDPKPTGIKNVLSSPHADDTYYDLQGRKVIRPSKGLYIVNGKTVVVK